MSICKPNCVTVLPNFGAIDDCDVNSRFSSGEIGDTGFIKCNEPFDDIDDPAEWADKISSGVITIPFGGNGKIDEQSESGEIRYRCQTVSTICQKPFEHTSYITDTESQTEWALYNQILAQRFGLAVFFITCDGTILINPDWVPGENPGLKLSKVKISQVYPGEVNGSMYYKISGEISECRSMKRVKLSADTLATILSTQTGSGN